MRYDPSHPQRLRLSEGKLICPSTCFLCSRRFSHKAKTPIVAGSICGGIMLIAYIVGFTIYFMKRRRRKERDAKVAAGAQIQPQDTGMRIVVIPPDPAVVLGLRRPGEHVSFGSGSSNSPPATSPQPSSPGPSSKTSTPLNPGPPPLLLVHARQPSTSQPQTQHTNSTT
jgi:hypothetical protein